MRIIATITLILFIACEALAGTALNTQCTKVNTGGPIEGMSINSPYTVASVTKVFTSHWAIARLGLKYRFPTIVHITPLPNKTFDVHFEGANYPYFDKDMYQFFVGELNRIGVKHVNKLTYDENFNYASDVRYDPMLAHGNEDQNLVQIMKDLRKDSQNINGGLVRLNAKAMTIENLKLPARLTLRVNDIRFLEKREFNSAPSTVSLYLPSSELSRNLKEMNRNSNNYVADRFFKMLSVKENYLDFILTRLLTVHPSEVAIINGSGYPVLVNGSKVYNKASCTAVLEMMSDLRNSVIQAGFNLQDILPVAGKDTVEDGNSTVTQLYGSNVSNGVLLGKTGSVLDTVALAGLIVTENENLFFQTSFAVDGPEDRASAYSKIKTWITGELIKNKKKSALDQYVPKAFLPFDKNSQLRKIESNNFRQNP